MSRRIDPNEFRSWNRHYSGLLIARRLDDEAKRRGGDVAALIEEFRSFPELKDGLREALGYWRAGESQAEPLTRDP